jgi:predicted PurR-regulated permease PerM
MLFVALYTLFYFYVDGNRFIAWFKDTVPLEPRHSSLFLESFFTSSIATLKMIGVIGVIQGVLAGIAYVIIGVPAPFFLTMLTILASVVPSVGAGLVIVPVVIGLFIAGKTAWAVALLVWLIVVIGNVDTILRPHLLHKSMRLHQLVIFVATLGGIARFGFFGVLIGPVVASLFSASLDVYRELYPRPTGDS